jgi:hypothetical protein
MRLGWEPDTAWCCTARHPPMCTVETKEQSKDKRKDYVKKEKGRKKHNNVNEEKNNR